MTVVAPFGRRLTDARGIGALDVSVILPRTSQLCCCCGAETAEGGVCAKTPGADATKSANATTWGRNTVCLQVERGQPRGATDGDCVRRVERRVSLTPSTLSIRVLSSVAA